MVPDAIPEKREKNEHDPDIRKSFIGRIGLYYVMAAVLSMVIIFGLRGFMNAYSRIDYILQRLDDYPELYESYRKEMIDWDAWWIDEDHELRDAQAAVLYQYMDYEGTDSEKLDYIRKLLGAKEAFISTRDETVEKLNGWLQDPDIIVSSAPLTDGRYISLCFSKDMKESHLDSSEIPDSFIGKVEAGLPGHILIFRNDALSVYPKDDEGFELLDMVRDMLESGELDPLALRDRAERENKSKAVSWMRNPGLAGIEGGRYLLFSAAYTNNDSYVISAVQTEDILRLSGKRSWSLWFLFLALIFLLGVFLYRMYSCLSGQQEHKNDVNRKTQLLLGAAVMLLLFSILYIQLVSAVNQSAQSAEDEAAFLQNVLQQEEERKHLIESEYDAMFQRRVDTIGSVLADHPEMKDPYILYLLDEAMGGSGLEITGTNGVRTASDGAFSQVLSAQKDSHTGSIERSFQTLIKDKKGMAVEVLNLKVLERNLDELLEETNPQEIIRELHILDSINVVAVDFDHRDKIIASTFENWIGDDPKEHNVDPEPFYDEYEGIVSFGNQNCYTNVFLYNDLAK